MGNFVFNISKGRVAELYNRVKAGDPSAARLKIRVLATTGLEADSALIDKDTFADVVSGATNEVTNTNYAIKTLAAADLAAMAPDDGNDRMDLDIPDQTWSAVQAGDGWSKLVVCYSADGSDTPANNVPLSAHDFVVTPNGTDIVAQVATAGFYRAS